MSNTAASIPVPRSQPVVLADLVPIERARDLILVVCGAVMVGLLAQVAIPLPFTPVPITGQTFGALLVGAGLGWRRGISSMVLYTLAGLVGVPWFAGHQSGWAMASFGYIIGMVIAAGVCGYLAERRADRTPLKSLPMMALGSVIIYAVGVTWLAVSIHVGPAEALSKGLYPFLIGDAIKALIAAAALPTAWRLAGYGSDKN